MLGFKLIVVGELPKISTWIGVTTNGKEIIIKAKQVYNSNYDGRHVWTGVQNSFKNKCRKRI